MDATRRLLIGAAAVAAVLAAAASAAVDPAVVQARYDAARDREEALLRAPQRDLRALRRVRAEIAWTERYDFRPRGWRGARDVPHTPLPTSARRSRGPRSTDAQLAARLSALGRSYGGWAAFWVHDLSTGATAGWNADARFPAASMVKLGALAAALRAYAPRPERSPLWYDLRQLAGWSSNLAANRIVAELGLPRVHAALRALGMSASTYPGPYRVGTTVADAPKPPPVRTWRVTTARDLGLALYALHATATGNRYLARRTGLTPRLAGLALELLLDGHARGDNAGLVRPFLGRIPVAQKNGWTSELRGTAALLYGARGPKIVVLLVHRPRLPRSEALALGRRFAALVRP